MGINMELVPPLRLQQLPLFWEGFPLNVGTLLQGHASIQPQSAFQFIPKVFEGVEVRALCRPVKFFHTDLDKPYLYGPHFVHRGIIMLKQGLTQTVATKLEAQTRQKNFIACCTVKISLHWN